MNYASAVGTHLMPPSSDLMAQSNKFASEQLGSEPPATDSLGATRPKKAVRFQVYNAKDMESLRSMRHTMEEKFNRITQRSRSPVVSRAELISQLKQQISDS